MNARPERDLVREFEQALDRGELHMLYQPKVRIETGDLTRLEYFSSGVVCRTYVRYSARSS